MYNIYYVYYCSGLLAESEQLNREAEVYYSRAVTIMKNMGIPENHPHMVQIKGAECL